MSHRRNTAAGLLAFALGACVQEAPPRQEPLPGDTIPPPPYNESTMPQTEPPSAGVPGAPQELNRPETATAVLLIEGTPDTVATKLVRSPTDFPAGFTTYTTDDMPASVQISEDGVSIQFTAQFGGVRNERAYLQVFLYPAGTTRATATGRTEAFVSGLNPEIDLSEAGDRYAWAFQETRFGYPHEDVLHTGYLALAERGTTLFHVLYQYPAEYGDGMAPRIALILDEWRWRDGSGLRQ